MIQFDRQQKIAKNAIYGAFTDSFVNIENDRSTFRLKFGDNLKGRFTTSIEKYEYLTSANLIYCEKMNGVVCEIEDCDVFDNDEDEEEDIREYPKSININLSTSMGDINVELVNLKGKSTLRHLEILERKLSASLESSVIRYFIGDISMEMRHTCTFI